MTLTDHEILMLLKFHQAYWLFENFLFLKKPPIISFCINNKIPQNSRNMKILALYYFNYWFLKYVNKMPTIQEIQNYYQEKIK